MELLPEQLDKLQKAKKTEAAGAGDTPASEEMQVLLARVVTLEQKVKAIDQLDADVQLLKKTLATQGGESC